MHKDCIFFKIKFLIKNPNPNTYFYIKYIFMFYIIQRLEIKEKKKPIVDENNFNLKYIPM